MLERRPAGFASLCSGALAVSDPLAKAPLPCTLAWYAEAAESVQCALFTETAGLRLIAL